MTVGWTFAPSNERARISRLGLPERLPVGDADPLSLSESSKIVPTLDVLRLIVFPSVLESVPVLAGTHRT